jgi:hypothetical protein
MTSLHRYTCKATLVGLCLAAASGAYAQVSSINSVIISHVFNDIPGATPSSFNSYPGNVTLNESGVSRTNSGGANRDVWFFSNNGGASAYQFQNNNYFNASFNITLAGNGNPASVGLEAGWLFSNPSGSIGGDLQSIVKGNGEVVQFGGPSFFGFSPADGGTSVPNYTEGQTYAMGLNYILDPNTGRNAFQYSVNGVFALSSPGNRYFDLGPGAGPNGSPGSTLGGYFQIGNDPSHPNNNGTATFSAITITPIPEPSTFALLSMGIVALGAVVSRRRRI